MTETTLSEVCIKITDGAHYSPKSVQEGYPMASVKDLSRHGINVDGCRRISHEDYQLLVSQGCNPRANDVLISKDGASALDTVCIIRENLELVLLSSVAILRPNPDEVFPQYLRYYLDSPVTRAYMKNAFTSGAAIPRVVLKDFKRVKINLSPLPTQRKIASILSAYDDLIENNLRRIQILEEMAQNLYREWFVNFRFPGHEKVKFVDSPLGKIPEGWEVTSMGRFCSRIFSGGTPSTKVETYWGGEKKWLSSGETDQSIILDTTKSITELGVSESSTKLAIKGDVVIASAGQGKTRGQVSYCAIDTYINQSVIAIRTKEEAQFPYFVYVNLSNRYDELRSVSDSSSSRGSITCKLLDSFPLINPKQEYLQKWENMVSPSFSLVACLLKSNANLRQTRDLLLPKLISGQLDVSNLDIEIPEDTA